MIVISCQWLLSWSLFITVLQRTPRYRCHIEGAKLSGVDRLMIKALGVKALEPIQCTCWTVSCVALWHCKGNICWLGAARMRRVVIAD